MHGPCSSSLLIAALGAVALGTPWAQTKSAPLARSAPSRTLASSPTPNPAAHATNTLPAPRSPTDSPPVVAAHALLSAGIGPPHSVAQSQKPSLAPPALAVPSRPGKNPQTALGGPAKYDAKKGALLGGAALPHRR